MKTTSKPLKFAFSDLVVRIKVNFRPLVRRTGKFFIKNLVVVFAVLSAIISCFFVPPDKEYLKYPSYKTLTCLFAFLLILRSLKHTKIFKIGSAKILEHIQNRKTLAFLLVFLPAFFALLITNDVASITFIPFAIVLLTMADCNELIPRVLILQTMACRLAGVISPLGNVQNLFLLDFYDFPIFWFIENLWPLAFVGYLVVFLGCMTVRSGKITILPVGSYQLQKGKIALYFALFILTILAIFDILPYYIITPIVALTILLVHKYAFVKVRYSILVMFLAFFVLAGNLQRIEGVNTFLSTFLNNKEYPLSVLASQILTNTPVALLFPNFSDAVLPLMFGINVGKFGTCHLNNYMVYSMYSKYDPKKNFGRKLVLVSFLFLFLLYPVGYFVLLLQ